MSISRKKVQIDEFNLSTIAQRSKRQHNKSQFRRTCCDKQNEHSRDCKSHKAKEESRSSKKKIKKKFIEEQIEKMIEKRYREEEERGRLIKQSGSSEIQTLKYDVEEMKNVISKLSIDEFFPKENVLTQLKNQSVTKKLKFQDKNVLMLSSDKNTIEVKSPLKAQPYEVQLHQHIITIQQLQKQKQINQTLHKTHLSELQAQLSQVKQWLHSANARIQEEGMIIEGLQRQNLEQKDQMKRNEDRICSMGGQKDRLAALLFDSQHKLKDLTVRYDKLMSISMVSDEQNQLSSENYLSSDRSSSVDIQSLKVQTYRNYKSTRYQYEQIIFDLQSKIKLNQIELQDYQHKLQNHAQVAHKLKLFQQQITKQRERKQKYEQQIQGMLKQVNDSIGRLIGQKNELSDIVSEVRSRYYQLASSLQKLKAENHRLFDDKAKLSKQLKTKQEQMRQAKAKAYQQQRLILQQQEAFDVKKKEYLLEKQGLAIELDELRQQRDEIETKVRQLNTKLMKLQQRNLNKRQRIGELQKQVVASHEMMKQKSDELSACKLQLQSMERINAAARQQCEELQLSLRSSQSRWQSERIIYDNDISVLNSSLAQLHTQIKAKEQAIDQLGRQNAIKQLHCQQASRQVHKLREEIGLRMATIEQQQAKIVQLKTTISAIKCQSLQIKGQVQEYKSQLQEIITERQHYCHKSAEQEQLMAFLENGTRQQLEHLKQRLEWLTMDKIELQRQLSGLQQKYQVLSTKCIDVEQHSQKLAQALVKKQKQNEIKLQIWSLKEQMTEVQGRQARQREAYESQLKMKQQSIQMLTDILQQERKQCKAQLSQMQSSNSARDNFQREEHQLIQRYKRCLNQKDQELTRLSDKLKLYEMSKSKVVSEVMHIQNQIAEMAEKTNSLQLEKAGLQASVASLTGVITRLRQQCSEDKKRYLMGQQRYRRQMQQLSRSYQQKRGQIVNCLRDKIKQLTNQLSLNISKIAAKNVQIQQLSKQYQQLQQLLKQNHQLLLEEKRQHEKTVQNNSQLSQEIKHYKQQHYHHLTDRSQHQIQIQIYKQQVTLAQKQSEQHLRVTSSYHRQVAELEVRCEGLKKRNEYLQHATEGMQREIENRQMSLRVLKGENANLQKVMSEQIGQRNGIIEQLVHEKRLLYAQMNSQ